MKPAAFSCWPVCALALMGCLLLTGLTAGALAEDTRPRVTLVQTRPGAAGELTERVCAELEMLGIAAQVVPARSADLALELATQAQSEGHPSAAAIVPGRGAATLWFAQAGTGRLSAHTLHNAGADALVAWALQAVELLRPELLALGTRPRASAPAPTRAALTEAELPPGLVADRASEPEAQGAQPRFATELGLGVLSSRNLKPSAPVLAALVGVNATRFLRFELLGLVPLRTTVYREVEATTRARATLLGLQLRVALLERARWELGLAFGAALAIVAYARSAESEPDEGWTRSTAPSMYARLGTGVKLAGALSLRVDVSVGTVIDVVRLSDSGRQGPSWGQLWLAGVFGLAAAFL